jgi:hypothetical protein
MKLMGHSDSQTKVQQIKANLLKAKQVLQERKTHVVNLWLRSKQRKEMIKMLDAMLVTTQRVCIHKVIMPNTNT